MKFILAIITITVGLTFPTPIVIITLLLIIQSEYVTDDILDYLLISIMNENFNLEMAHS